MGPMVQQYLETALWSSNDEDDNPLDRAFDVSDFSETALAMAREDCHAFQKRAGSLLDGLDSESVGHDFWLTRNHHGAGFWDGDYKKELGEQLTALSHSFRELNIFVDENKKLYFE